MADSAGAGNCVDLSNYYGECGSPQCTTSADCFDGICSQACCGYNICISILDTSFCKNSASTARMFRRVKATQNEVNALGFPMRG